MHYLCVQTLWWRDHWKQFCFAPVWLIKSCMWWNIGICSSDSKTEKKNDDLDLYIMYVERCGNVVTPIFWNFLCDLADAGSFMVSLSSVHMFNSGCSRFCSKMTLIKQVFKSRSPEFLLQILTDLWQHLFEKEFLKLLVFSHKSSAPLMHSVQQRWFQTAMLYLIWCR